MPKLPNILWICTDEQRFDTIAALGNPHLQTPHVDRLVDRGVAFTHAFCQSPICTPSRASFLTGMYPSSVHACGNGNDYWAHAAPLVTKVLADAGYDCGLAGKLHLAGTHGRIEPRGEDGYRVFHWSHGPSDDWPEGHDYAEWVRDQGLDCAEFDKNPETIPPELHQTTWCADKAIEFMRESRSDRPWLMSVNCFDPHPPLNPPQQYRERFHVASLPGAVYRDSDRDMTDKLWGVDFHGFVEDPIGPTTKQMQADYYAMIELIDANVGRMVDALEESRQADNTIIIFMSDHGDMVGDHGLLHKGCRFFDPLVRVPLVISCPSRFQQELRADALVELIDIAPTLLQVANLPIPARMQGKSLLPILTGQADSHCHREYVRSEFYHALSSVGRNHINGSYATMLRDRRFKLVVYHGFQNGELYDLEEDPLEFDNLWDDPGCSDVRFRLMKQSFDALAFAVDRGPEQTTQF